MRFDGLWNTHGYCLIQDEILKGTCITKHLSTKIYYAKCILLNSLTKQLPPDNSLVLLLTKHVALNKVIICLKYCRYGITLYPINQTINLSIYICIRTQFTSSLNLYPCKRRTAVVNLFSKSKWYTCKTRTYNSVI